ncbi:MAG: tRNA pseudouridine(55) synthase TruB [Eubacterium sp.]|nr:tRNA pseudouridine(55) synthase TruB [Eubacterium sp.]
MIETGILNIYKERGMTSHDVVSRLRRLIGIRRIGHTGTLDPMAEGVLPVCIGRAARIIEYLDLDIKTYKAVMLLGRAYDTQDVTGQVIREADEASVSAITKQNVDCAMEGFKGLIEQYPPMYSAVRVDGRRLYDYARAGETVNVKPRRVYITGLEVTDCDLGKGYESSVSFTVSCTKGTYIRAIANDAGEKLGTGAALSALERTASGMFRAEDAVKISELEAMTPEEIEELIISPDAPLGKYGKVILSGRDPVRFRDGILIEMSRAEMVKEPDYTDSGFYLPIPERLRDIYLAYSDEGNFIGIAKKTDENLLRPEKVFVG